MKAILLISLYITMSYGMQLRKTNMPFELRRAMANVTSLDSFLRAMQSTDKGFMSSLRNAVRSLNNGRKIHHQLNQPVQREICPTLTRLKQCPLKQEDLCKSDFTCFSGAKCCDTGCRKECSRPTLSGLARFAENWGDSDLPHVILDSAKCEPRPVAVEVAQPAEPNALNFPLFVTLHRCGGACNERPFDTKCQVKETQDLNLLVSKVTWSTASDKLSELAKEIRVVRVTNHTKCGCLCAVKPADCNNRTQVYSEVNCRCECKSRGVLCPFNFRWNPEKCQCTCNPSVQIKCNKRYQFDDKLCRCVCSAKACKMAIKQRDPRDCRCKCLPLKCPAGMDYDLRTCMCVSGRIGRMPRNRRKRLM